MSDFQRFVTYINLYEENSKVRNVGFAKIEQRSEQCKVEIHMRGTGFTGISCPVYLFVRENEKIKGIAIGKMQMTGGNGEYRGLLEAENIMESGFTMEQMGGLMIFVNDKIMFASQWDEKEIRRERFEVWENKTGSEDTAERKQQEIDIIGMRPAGEKTGDIRAAENSPAEPEAAQSERMGREPVKQPEAAQSERMGREPVKQPEAAEAETVRRGSVKASEGADSELQEESASAIKATEAAAQAYMQGPRLCHPCRQPAKAGQRQSNPFQAARTGQRQVNSYQQQPKQGQRPEQTWAEKWQFILENLPVLTPFEGEENILCVRMELKDIRMLPKRYWYLGNNSFLLHGFFNYRYLILGAMEQEDKKRWFIGVPGIYQNQEKVMAAIFGFPEYKCEKISTQKTGQFGYWYRFMDE